MNRWGERTPFVGEGSWPERVDASLEVPERDVERCVSQIKGGVAAGARRR
ncbi:MAG TPA: hypothetical protein VLB89_00100 [Gaiellaceae bacterium]|nr:hypothetical protein [Gaiellaceae bacterium]